MPRAWASDKPPAAWQSRCGGRGCPGLPERLARKWIPGRPMEAPQSGLEVVPPSADRRALAGGGEPRCAEQCHPGCQRSIQSVPSTAHA